MTGGGAGCEVEVAVFGFMSESGDVANVAGGGAMSISSRAGLIDVDAVVVGKGAGADAEADGNVRSAAEAVSGADAGARAAAKGKAGAGAAVVARPALRASVRTRGPAVCATAGCAKFAAVVATSAALVDTDGPAAEAGAVTDADAVDAAATNCALAAVFAAGPLPVSVSWAATTFEGSGAAFNGTLRALGSDAAFVSSDGTTGVSWDAGSGIACDDAATAPLRTAVRGFTAALTRGSATLLGAGRGDAAEVDCSMAGIAVWLERDVMV